VEGGVPEDPYNVKTSRGPASFNIPHIFTANVVYDLPIGVGKRFSTNSRVINHIIGNWQISSIILGRSGQNFTVTSSGDIAETGNGSTYERANLVGNPWVGGPAAGNPTCALSSSQQVRTAMQWFNPCAFQTPATGTLGNSGRNILQDQTFWDMDASVHRIFPIGERMKVQAVVDAFNALNHPVLGTPGASTTSPSTLGVITSTADGYNPRTLQGSVKILF
jgi:hypothetical protein